MTVKPSGRGCDPHSRTLNIYLNLYFHSTDIRSGVVAKHGVKFRHSITKKSKKVNSVLTLGSLCLPTVCMIRREADLILIIIMF